MACAGRNFSGGQVNVGRVSGPADVATSDGGITIDSVAGKLRAHTSGGGISLQGE